MDVQEPDWIRSDPRNLTVYSTLLSFLEEASADRANFQELVDTTIGTLYSALTPDLTADQYKFELRTLFAIILTIVKDIDAAAPQQEHLVSLVVAIRNTPLPQSVSQTIDEYDPYSEMNQDLTPLINVFSDFERDAPLHPPLDERPEMADLPVERTPWRKEPGNYVTAREWTNLNAFIARIHAAVPDVPKLDLRGLFAMIEALEQPLTPTPLEDVLPAAAVWIVHAGQTLRSNSIAYAFYPDGGRKRLPWSRGELWDGEHAFNSDRWTFWMRRFRDIADMEGVSDSVRSAALEAIEAGS